MAQLTVTLADFATDLPKYLLAANAGDTVVVTEDGACLATVSDGQDARRARGWEAAYKLGARWSGKFPPDLV